MLHRNGNDWIVIALVPVMALAGCAGTGTTASLGLPAAPELPKMPAALAELPKLPAAHGHAQGSPLEVYSHIARGATRCWFGAGGALRKTHIFNADAEPPSTGGKPEIGLLERDPAAQNGRGARAYRIALVADASGTLIDQESQKLPEALVTAIKADVHRFAQGDLDCATTGALAPVLEMPPLVAAAKTKPAKKRVAGKS